MNAAHELQIAAEAKLLLAECSLSQVLVHIYVSAGNLDCGLVLVVIVIVVQGWS
jgi:hypothetical protein